MKQVDGLFWFMVLMLLQLYRGWQFYWWRKSELLE